MKFNKKSGAFVGLAALAAIGGTWAYYNQTAALTNPFSTNQYNTSVVEHFNPAEGENWEPGAEVDKIVQAKNTGDYPVLVRAKMNETWKRGNDSLPFQKLLSWEDKEAIFSVEEIEDGIYKSKQIDSKDGKTANDKGKDETVVYKNLPEVGEGEQQWFFNEADGYWYWYGILESDQTTKALIDYVALSNDTDMGFYDETEYYYTIAKAGAESITDAAEGGQPLLVEGKVNPEFNIDKYLKEKGDNWKKVEEGETASDFATKDVYFFRKSDNDLKADAQGYAGANYDLTITTEFVQATKDAVWENTPEKITKLFDAQQ